MTLEFIWRSFNLREMKHHKRQNTYIHHTSVRGLRVRSESTLTGKYSPCAVNSPRNGRSEGILQKTLFLPHDVWRQLPPPPKKKNQYHSKMQMLLDLISTQTNNFSIFIWHFDSEKVNFGKSHFLDITFWIRQMYFFFATRQETTHQHNIDTTSTTAESRWCNSREQVVWTDFFTDLVRRPPYTEKLTPETILFYAKIFA